jgi:hypothetical protein
MAEKKKRKMLKVDRGKGDSDYQNNRRRRKLA